MLVVTSKQTAAPSAAQNARVVIFPPWVFPEKAYTGDA